jgi:inhibitor of KinA sporulation pathway (predicted exonuclease)
MLSAKTPQLFENATVICLVAVFGCGGPDIFGFSGYFGPSKTPFLTFFCKNFINVQ